MRAALHRVYDLRAVIQETVRVLVPGGVVLATLPCASRLVDEGQAEDFWRFTASAARRLFGESFHPDRLDIRSYGNVLTTIGFLYGVGREELTNEELEVHDPYFPLIIGVRAQL
jgi:hypothetical protein